MQIVERIKARCKEKGTSMNALEKELGFGNGNIRRWDERIPGADRVLLLANKLEVSVDWLLTGKEAAELSPEEQKLVNYYRNTNSTGRLATMGTAKMNSELMPQEQQSSTSKIG